jgi:hypothetical protein
MNIQSILTQLAALSIDDQRAVNRHLVDMIKRKQRGQMIAASAKLNIGQIVRFTKPGRGRNAGTHFIKIESFNRAGTAVVGHEVDPTTKQQKPFSPRWTVSTTSCTVVA